MSRAAAFCLIIRRRGRAWLAADASARARSERGRPEPRRRSAYALESAVDLTFYDLTPTPEVLSPAADPFEHYETVAGGKGANPRRRGQAVYLARIPTAAQESSARAVHTFG